MPTDKTDLTALVNDEWAEDWKTVVTEADHDLACRAYDAGVADCEVALRADLKTANAGEQRALRVALIRLAALKAEKGTSRG